MGRELRRVPLGFKWPLHQVWNGYLNPYRFQECKPCEGSGLNPATKQIDDDFYDFAGTGRKWCAAITQDEVDALVAHGRLRLYVGGEEGWRTVPRTAEEVNAANARCSVGMHDCAHDGINKWILIETRAKRLGVFGHCEFCGGEGHVWQSPEIKRLHEEWKKIEPPTGPGFQLWETTSEGSPVSPVFETLDALCEWCAEGATTFGSAKTTAAEWRRMLDDGHVCHQVGNAVFI